jgi:hypothetical protein
MPRPVKVLPHRSMLKLLRTTGAAFYEYHAQHYPTARDVCQLHNPCLGCRYSSIVSAIATLGPAPKAKKKHKK